MLKQIYKIDTVNCRKGDSFASILVNAQVNSGGWTNPKLIPFSYMGNDPSDGIYDYMFCAEAPDGPVIEVLTPITLDHIINPLPDNYIGIRVHASSNYGEDHC